MATTLNAKQLRFAALYQQSVAVGKSNATQNYLDAYPGCSRASAESAAARLLKDVRVQQLLRPAKQAAEVVRPEQVQRIQATSVAVLERFWAIATADPNELIELRRTCCRYCHDSGFRYQRTQGELERDRAIHEADKKTAAAPFDLPGGPGYDPRKAPHASCPECFVEGLERVFAKDTRHLSPAARCLYAGVNGTKEGIEVKMHDQQAALVNVGKILGAFDRSENEAPAGPTNVNVTVVNRIDQYAAAFAGAADREEAGVDGSQALAKPVVAVSPTGPTPGI